jgi:hypothetical protein
VVQALVRSVLLKVPEPLALLVLKELRLLRLLRRLLPLL